MASFGLTLLAGCRGRLLEKTDEKERKQVNKTRFFPSRPCILMEGVHQQCLKMYWNMVTYVHFTSILRQWTGAMFLVFDGSQKLLECDPDSIGIRLNTIILSNSYNSFSIFVL